MAKPVEYRVQVCKDGAVTASLQLVRGCESVEVGRSHQCALCTPGDDPSVSGHHARIFWRGRTLFVEDAGSRNGVLLRGRLLRKPCAVKPGMIFSIGNCTLHFDLAGDVGKNVTATFHKLEFLNGDRTGQQVEIRPKDGETDFTIGLDPDNALALSDMLVSRHHAFLETKENGECWLHDCGSRNGTYVNGEKLASKERLLKDNDRISIAYFDFRFLDRTKRHKRFFLWVKVFAVAATLCAMAAAYVVWVTASDKTEDFLRLARQSAEVKNFNLAHEVLQQARLARDASKYQLQIEKLYERIEVWRNTAEVWGGVKASLVKGTFGEALKQLDPIVGGGVDLWGWNGTDAIVEKGEAEFAANALRAVTEAEDALGNAEDGLPEQQADQMRSAEAALKTFQTANAARLGKYAYLATYTNHLAQTMVKLAFVLAGFESVDVPIGKLDGLNPDFAALAVRLDTIARDARQNGSVRSYAEKYKQPCMELAVAKQFIRTEFDDLNAMRFAEVRTREKQLQLPKVELCQRHPQLSEHRAKLEGHHRDAQRLARNLEALVNGLAEFGVVSGTCGLPIQHVLSEDSWKQVLTFPCFKEKPPTVRRRRPTGFYDELLGIDYTFQSIRALPNAYEGLSLRMIGFSPDCVEARHAFENVESFVAFLGDSPKWLRKGDLGAFFDFCRQLLERRDAVVAKLAAHDGSPREKLLAGFYAEFLAREPNGAKRKELALAFRNLQKRVADLCEKYEDACDPIEQISIRAQILALALPGDPQIHAKWVQMNEGQIR